MELAPDFDEFIGSLTAHGVEFVVVGATARHYRDSDTSDLLSTPSISHQLVPGTRDSHRASICPRS